MTKMTPCEELGYKVGDKFEVLESSAGFTPGAIIELYEDDGSDCPIFKGLNSQYKHCDGEEGTYLELDNVKKIEGEKTHCQKLGYEIGDKFEVISDDEGVVPAGTLVTLTSDTNSRSPWFADDYGNKHSLWLHEVKKIEETPKPTSMKDLYPEYYKDVSHLSEIDVYAVHDLFPINDPSGCIQHASKKLLLSGVRTGGKPAWKDIKEARDTLTRKLQLMGIE
ncbi:hypothetical protein M316_0096 [Nitrincola phage 1M3-16]|uniref:hypothetical protein n=1 Tax=Nitrincola phage 1M3-16 TaxID=1472912 RepID=UPI000444D884|nr:hypothetical protein GJ22_gp056 [Nitrincola phage 1M3-16]AHX01161.1 hypothetical protein M316_0096 [Nitrincola phage 1M3-16]